MADLLGWGAAWLDGQRRQHLSRTVVYVRGPESVELPATIGRTLFELDHGFGLEKFETRDYLVSVADLVLAGSPTLPQRGDRIQEGNFVYEVMSPARDKPPWRYSDPFRQTLRIHTKLIDVL